MLGDERAAAVMRAASGALLGGSGGGSLERLSENRRKGAVGEVYIVHGLRFSGLQTALDSQLWQAQSSPRQTTECDRRSS